MEHPNNALIIGISGVSSSGKTTLARLIRNIFPNTFILHEDDFYKPDAEIPLNPSADNVADWDCLEALDLPKFQESLQYIRRMGMPPPDLISKEDKNDVGKVDVDAKVVKDLEWKAGRWMFQDVPPIAIIDGFLMYSEGMKEIRDHFDVKILLQTDFATGKRRREARSGYVTIEGWWEDPPGYWEKVVWPNYVKDHAFLFENKDVEAKVKEDVVEQLGVDVMPEGMEGNMTALVEWAYEVVSQALEKRIGR
jgi:nicotinamide/nicotinate riboside kinase